MLFKCKTNIIINSYPYITNNSFIVNTITRKMVTFIVYKNFYILFEK